MPTRLCVALVTAAGLAVAGCPGDGSGLGDGTARFAGPSTDRVHRRDDTRFEADFGAVALGRIDALSFWIGNTGTVPLEVQHAAVGGTDAWAFEVSPADLRVAPGGTGRLTIRFSPFREGPLAADLSFGTNDPDAVLVQVALAGEGVRPILAATPAHLDFGGVVRSSARPLSLALTNAGQAEACVRLVLSATAAVYGFELDPAVDGADLLVPAGGDRSLTVRFRPRRLGPAAATLEARACDGAALATVDLAGVGLRAGLVVDPPVVDFGKVPPGLADEATVRFANVGNLPVRIEALDLDDPTVPPAAPEFTLAPVEALPLELPPATAREVTVRFAPPVRGHFDARLTWRSDDPGAPAGEVVLIGDGGGGRLTLSSEAVDFGPVAVGTSLRRTFVVFNAGEDPLDVSGTVEGAEGLRLLYPTGTRELAPGAAETFALEWAPRAAGPATGRLRLVSDDFLHPELAVPLSASGESLPPCELAVTPERLELGAVPEGEVRSRIVTLAHVGEAGDCLVRDLRLTEETPTELALPGGPVDVLRLAPGERAGVEVRFAAGARTPVTGALTFQVSDPARPTRTVALSAWSLDPRLAPEVAPLDFGRVGPPCPLATRTLCLRGTGPADAVISGFALDDPAGAFRIERGFGGQVFAGDRICADLSFRPAAPGPYGAAARITLAGLPAPLLVPLTGVGDAALADPAADRRCLAGRVATASATAAVPGAAVTVTVPDGAGGTRELTTETDCAGFFRLPAVPAGLHPLRVRTGSFLAHETVPVADGLTELAQPVLLDPKTPAVAVLTTSGDVVADLLQSVLGATAVTVVGGGYPPDLQAQVALLADPVGLQAYDVLVLTDGLLLDALGPAQKDNVVQFVADGGTVYAGYAARAFVEGLWPGRIAHADEIGETVEADTLVPLTAPDPVWAACLGPDPVLPWPRSSRVLDVAVADPSVARWLDAELPFGTGDATVPLVLSFPAGAGRVVFSQWRDPFDPAAYGRLARTLRIWQLLRL